MSKANKKQPLLFPVGDEMVDQAAYITAKTKAVKKANKGVSVEEKDIKSILKIVLSGEELADDTEAVWQAVFKEVSADVEKGKEAQKEAEAAEAAKGNRELTVLDAALNLDKIDRKKLDTHFTSGSNFVTINEDATDEEVAQKFAVAVVISDFGPWAIGDLGNELQNRGLEGVIENFCTKTGRSGATIYAHMRLARAIKKEDRKENILPTVYKELVFPTISADPKKDAKIKAKLIAQAEKDGWNSKEARSHADEAREAPAGNQGGAKKAAKFLSVPSDGEPFLTVEEPAWEEGVIVFNIAKAQILGEVERDGRNVIDWSDIIVKE